MFKSYNSIAQCGPEVREAGDLPKENSYEKQAARLIRADVKIGTLL